jgi:outer membrane protein insertion porin family
MQGWGGACAAVWRRLLGAGQSKWYGGGLEIMWGMKKSWGIVWFCFFFLLASRLVWAEDQQPKVAVLPFVMHGQQDAAKAQKSIDEVFVKLFAREGLKLIDPQEAQRAAGGPVNTEERARAVGGRLGAAYAVFGSFNQIGNAISIDATLVDVSGRKKPVVLLAEEKGIENLASAAGKIVQQIGANVLSKAVVAEVKIKGNDRIEAEAIKGTVKTKKGEVLKPEQVSEDIRSIYKMGFFEKVDAEISEAPGGKVLTFVVVENPTIQEVKLNGNKKVKEKDIMAAIVTKPYSILQRNVVSEDVQKILKLYQQKGYYNAQITSKIDFPKDPRKAFVYFNIAENDKVYIKSIEFSGNVHFKARKLRGVMQTKAKSFLSWITDYGILQKDILDTDVDRITAFYHDEGYMDAKVSAPNVQLQKDGFHITISIEEGERYKVAEVKVTGDLLEDNEKKVLRKMECKSGDYFSREKLRHDMDMITKAYMNEGYARVDVEPRVMREAAVRTASMAFVITKKEVVRIGQIFVTGNSKTRDNVIRREMKIFEGDVYSAKKIDDSLSRLKRLDFFETVEIVPTDTEQKNIMNLNVKVKEKQTGSISIGGGYSTEDGLFASGMLQQKNLFGTGDSVSLKAYFGQLAQRYMISYTKPWLFGIPLSGGIDLYDWVRSYQDFTKDSYGFKVRAGYPLGQYSSAMLYYQLENAEMTNLDLLAWRIPLFRLNSNSYETKSAVGFSFERNTTDHAFLPTKGSYIGATLEDANKIVGSDFNLFKQEYHVGVYEPLFWKFIGHLRGEVGYEKADGGVNSFPIYERFFLGGINNLRGWKFGAVGPEFPNGVVYGGDKYVVGNAELLFPLAEKYGVRGVVFLDTGNAFSEQQSMDFSNFREDVGGGIRWNSPFGPLRIEAGYVLDRRTGEAPFQWQFSAGAFF